jgi:hypothetical protein
VALDGSMVVAANNAGTAYVWRMLRGASLTTHFEPLHKLRAHQGGWESPSWLSSQFAHSMQQVTSMTNVVHACMILR